MHAALDNKSTVPDLQTVV